MSINLINDFSKIYSEQIIESTVPGKPAERFGALTNIDIPKSEQDAARARILAKTKAKRKTQKPNDGNLANNYPPYDEITRGDVIAGRLGKDEMGGKKKKSKGMKEGFSNWRQDLSEVIDTINNKEKNDKIVEKNVNNKIIINPNIGEDVQFLESIELSEEYIDQIINLASQYFYSEGYDEDSVNVIAEGMGYDQFVDFIFDIGNTFFLDEAAYQGELLTAKGAARKNPKTSAAKGASTPVSHTPSKPKEDKPEKKKTSPEQLSIDYNKKPTPPGQQRVKDAVGNAVKKATSPEAKKAVGGAVKGAANTAARAALSAWKGHKAAMKKKEEGGSVAQQVGAGLGAAAGAFFKKGKSHLKDSYEFTDWLNYIVSEGCDISELTINDLYKQYKLNEAIYGQSKKLDEKAVSQNQQQLAAMAIEYLDGDMPDASDAVKQMAKMGRKELKKFAKTKHKGLPEKVKESMDQIPMTPGELNLQRKKSNIDLMIAKKRKEAIQKRDTNEEFVSEEDYDTIKDRHLERGGMGARSSTSPSKTTASKPMTDAERKSAIEKQRQAAQRAFELVRNQVIAKYGKNAVK